jgi:hypothetical protein
MRLQSIRSWRLLLVALLLAAPVTSAGLGDEESGRPVSLTFAVLKTQAGQPTIHGGSLGLELRPGEGSGVFSLTPHQDEGRLDQGCGALSVTMSVGPPAASPGSPVAWRVQARVLEASLEEIRVEVSWTRLVAEGGAGFVEGRVASPEVVSLRPGDRLLLDFVEDPPFPRQGCIDNLALELSASFPVVEEATGLAYEIWMVHEDPSGRTESRKWMSRSLQGEEATFRFPRTTLEGRSELTVDIQGGVRGWVRRDGELDLILEAYRGLAFVDRTAMVGETGRKSVRVEPGEAVRLVLPGEPAGEGADDRFGGALEGHAFSLVVVARPVE